MLIENEANIFAANLLMPSDDFVKQYITFKYHEILLQALPVDIKFSISAAALRWLHLARGRMMLISSKRVGLLIVMVK